MSADEAPILIARAVPGNPSRVFSRIDGDEGGRHPRPEKRKGLPKEPSPHDPFRFRGTLFGFVFLPG
jgi:hypothetical protein